MSIHATFVAPRQALPTLARVIAAAKGTDTLAPVTVAVPTNMCGVMTRRALGRAGGVAGVDMVTLNRLAELIAGPQLAAAGRSPASTPVVDLTITAILSDDPGPFGAVATHPSTVVALREAHTELRLAEPARVAQLAEHSLRGRQAVRISSAVTDALQHRWYDEADLFTAAEASVSERTPPTLRSVVLHLPSELSGRATGFVRALGTCVDVQVIAQLTGDAAADDDARSLVAALAPTTIADHTVLGNESAGVADPTDNDASRHSVTIVSTTDADEEVRAAVRLIVDAARAGTPFERIALLWPAQRPYARLVEHHLTAADVPWNGRTGTSIAEHLVPRFVLDLLDVDRRGLRRRSLFDLLADVAVRDHDAAPLPTAAWERVSRYAGVARDDDWDRRLGSLSGNQRWGEQADSLRAFVGELRNDLGHPASTRTWSAWAVWCTEQIDQRLGETTIARLDESEYRAFEALTAAIDRLGHLDPVSGPVTRHGFRNTLIAELDTSPNRRGRVGHGVTVAPLAGAVGLDVDVAIVVGAAEGLLPPRPTSDPLLSDSDRALAGLPSADARSTRLHRQFLATIATSDVTFIAPRGDLRATSTIELSRWVAPWLHNSNTVASHHAGLSTTSFPSSSSEHRLRGRAHRAAHPQRTVPGVVAGHSHDTGSDPALARGLAMLRGRGAETLTEFDGDLSSVHVPMLDQVVSPSRLESWLACPHAYFDRYLLDVEPVEEPGDEIRITARDRGTAHHHALDLFHQAVVDGELAQPGPNGWSDEHREALTRCFDDVSDRTERRGRTGRPAFWADERARMLDDLLAWLERDSELVIERGSVVLASEMRFDADDDVAIALPDGRRIALRGTVDRVDRTRSGHLVVTDHKSGDLKKFAGLSVDDPTLGGTLFQLPTYAAAARSRFGEPTTPVLAEYGLLRKGNYQRPGFLMTTAVDAAVGESLAHVVSGIESGLFPNVPDRPGWRPFVSCWYCEPDGLGTDDRWNEWQLKQSDPRLHAWFATPDPDGEQHDSPDAGARR